MLIFYKHATYIEGDWRDPRCCPCCSDIRPTNRQIRLPRSLHFMHFDIICLRFTIITFVPVLVLLLAIISIGLSFAITSVSIWSSVPVVPVCRWSVHGCQIRITDICKRFDAVDNWFHVEQYGGRFGCSVDEGLNSFTAPCRGFLNFIRNFDLF